MTQGLSYVNCLHTLSIVKSNQAVGVDFTLNEISCDNVLGLDYNKTRHYTNVFVNYLY